MNKQTAVEWLFAHLLPFLNDNGFADPLENKHFFECLSEAKAMEKEQIEEAFKHGNLPTFLGNVLTTEQYYKETYKSEKK
jgi:hypothetical protein